MQSSVQPLPHEIKLEFFAAICGDKTTDGFEQWLCGSSEVEVALRPDDYLDLLSLDYSSALASVNLIGILEKLVSAGEYET